MHRWPIHVAASLATAPAITAGVYVDPFEMVWGQHTRFGSRTATVLAHEMEPPGTWWAATDRLGIIAYLQPAPAAIQVPAWRLDGLRQRLERMGVVPPSQPDYWVRVIPGRPVQV